MKPDPPEFVTGLVTVRHQDEDLLWQLDLGDTEWRPKNLHPNGYAIGHFEVADEPDENGDYPVIVVLTGPHF